MDDQTFQIITALLSLLLAISEYMPFSQWDGNGLGHAILLGLSGANQALNKN